MQSKAPPGIPVKAVQLSLEFPRFAAADSDAGPIVKSAQFRSNAAATGAVAPARAPSRVKSDSPKSHLLSPEQLLRSPSDTRSSNGRGWGSTWDAQTSSLPLGIAVLLKESPNATDNHSSPRVMLDPLPFSNSRARHFVMERMSNVITGSQSPCLLSAKDPKFHEADADAHSISAPTNRSEALLLVDTFRMLREQLQRDVGVVDVFEEADAHAEHGKIEAVWKLLTEELGIAVSTLTELSRQVRCECAERGDLLQQVGTNFQRIVSVMHHCSSTCSRNSRLSSKHLAEAANREFMLQQQINDLNNQLAEKQQASLKFQSRIMDSGVSLAVAESHSRAVKENFDNSRKQEAEAFRNAMAEELALKELVSSFSTMSPIVCSKLRVNEVQLSRANVELDHVKAQLKASEQRSLADSAVIEHLRSNVRRLRIAGSWYRQCAFSKILSGSRPCDASVQTEPVHFAKNHEKAHRKSSVVDSQSAVLAGSGSGNAEAGGAGGGAAAGGISKAGVVDSGSDDERQENRYTSIPTLWTTVIRSALQSVLSMRPNDPSIELQPVFETVCQLYCSKIAADLQADSSHIRRQTLPEFMYSTYLFQTGEPSAAKHALTEFITLLFYFEKAHPRLRTFGKFLSNASGHSFDALNIFLAALSFCNFDRTPIINADTTFVDCTRIVPCCDYIFYNIKQAKKEELCMEAKTKFGTRHVNIDDFLEFIRLNFNREQSNVELRLKAIFVGADSDGDGNMDIDEFNSMIAITHSSLSHQQLLRMYSEMTLNSRVSSEVFVRVARLFRFCAFEVGPSEKRASSSAGQEMWALLDDSWAKLEPILLESLIVLEGTIMSLKMRECAKDLRVHLIHKKSVEQAFISYNELSALMKISIQNRLPDLEINQLMALKQRQKDRKGKLSIHDDGAHEQQEFDY